MNHDSSLYMTPSELKALYYQRNPLQEKNYLEIYQQTIRITYRTTVESRRRAMAPIWQALHDEKKFQLSNDAAHNQHISAKKTDEIFSKSIEIMKLFETHGFIIPRRRFQELLNELGIFYEGRWYCKGMRIMERLTADYGFFFCYQLTDYVLNCQWLDEEALRGEVRGKEESLCEVKSSGTPCVKKPRSKSVNHGNTVSALAFA